MTPEQITSLKDDVAKTIQVTVNGKIDKITQEILYHNQRHEKDMVRILPVIEAFEEAQNDIRVAKKGGKMVLWLAATVTALGGAVLIIMRLLGK